MILIYEKLENAKGILSFMRSFATINNVTVKSN